MGIQVRCPLCGLTRPPEKFGQYDLAAKEVRSLGGDRGFEHTEIEMPSNLEWDIEVAIARLYHRHVDRDPFTAVEKVEKQVEAVVESETTDETTDETDETGTETTDETAEIEAEIGQAIEHSFRIAEMEGEIERAAMEGAIEDAIDGALTPDQVLSSGEAGKD